MSIKYFLGLWAGVQILIMPLASASICPATIKKEKSLLIRDLSVVEDPSRTVWTGSTASPSDGAWSFGRLLANMAGNRDPSSFAIRWMNTLLTDRIINGDIVLKRSWIQDSIMTPWLALSPNGRLDLTKARMRLLAIVYRADERDLSRHLAGVVRFVYGAYQADPQDIGSGSPLSFTVILDYALPAESAADVAAWGWAFQSLSALRFGPMFNVALERITLRVTSKNADPRRPNGSALLQIRTNDAVQLNAPWVMREFRISRATGFLLPAAIGQTPAASFNNTVSLADWVNANRRRILASNSIKSIGVPLSFQGAPFRAGAITNTLGNYWEAPGAHPRAMFRVAVNTCDGCHGTETDTPFTHIFPRGRGEKAFISAFLGGNWTGIPNRQMTVVQDPRDTSRVRRFNELEFRRADLAAMLCPPPTVAASEVPTVGSATEGDPTDDAFGRGITGTLERGPSAGAAQ